MSAPKIGFICGSLRTDSINQKLQSALQARYDKAGAQTTLIDLGHYDLPLYHGDISVPQGVQALIDDMKSQDGIVVVSPEYNGGLPPLLKNAIDWTSTVSTDHFRNPVYGIAACSPGPMSGIMCMRQINYILMRVGANVLPTQVGVGNAAIAFDEEGDLITQPSSDLADKLIASMLLRISQIKS